MFFMSDGTAPYPADAIQKFRQENYLWNNLDFDAVGFGDEDFSVLERMAKAFPKSTFSEAKDGAALREVFRESFAELEAFVEDAGNWSCR